VAAACMWLHVLCGQAGRVLEAPRSRVIKGLLAWRRPSPGSTLMASLGRPAASQ
jgi:hypothetical protein